MCVFNQNRVRHCKFFKKYCPSVFEKIAETNKAPISFKSFGKWYLLYVSESSQIV